MAKKDEENQQAEETQAEEAQAEETPAEEAPAAEAETPAEEAPAEEAPAEQVAEAFEQVGLQADRIVAAVGLQGPVAVDNQGRKP